MDLKNLLCENATDAIGQTYVLTLAADAVGQTYILPLASLDL